MIRYLFAGFLVLGLVVPQGSQAASRSMAVLKSGQIVSLSSVSGPMSEGRGGSRIAFACEDAELAFSFTESASPESIETRRRDGDSGQISVSVSIDQVCVDSGAASFSYEMEGVVGQLGVDLSAQPAAFEIEVPIEQGAQGSQQVDYQVLERSASGESDKRFELVGTQISFSSQDGFGQASGRRVLAELLIVEGPPLNTDQPDSPFLDDRTRDSARAFNSACEDSSSTGAFQEVCEQVAGADLTDAEEVQVAEAFDPHEISAASGAAVEGGRIQMANIGSRIAALRGGASGLSLGGIALAYNGNTFDSSWLPVSLSSSAANSAGSTLLDERLGVFVNGEISLGDRDRRGKEVGFDFDSWGLTAGVDYRFDNGLIAGAAVGYSRYEADLDFDGGNLDSETLSLQLFGTYDVTDRIYLDMTLGAADLDFDQQRVVDLSGIGSLTRSVARGGAGGSQQSASLAVNYRFPWDSRWSAVSYGQAFIARTKIDSFEEHGSPFALAYPEQKFYSRTYTGGVRISRAVNFSNGVLTPFADASYSYEDGNDGYSIQPALIETGALGPLVEISDPDRSFGQFDAGVSWVFISGQQLFLRYSGLIGERDTTRHSIHFGARFEF